MAAVASTKLGCGCWHGGLEAGWSKCLGSSCATAYEEGELVGQAQGKDLWATIRQGGVVGCLLEAWPFRLWRTSKGQRKGEEQALGSQASVPGGIDAQNGKKVNFTFEKSGSLSGASLHGDENFCLVRISGKDLWRVVEHLSDTSLGGVVHGDGTAMPLPKLYAAAEAARVVIWKFQINDVKVAAGEKLKSLNLRACLVLGFYFLLFAITVKRFGASLGALVSLNAESRPNMVEGIALPVQASSQLLSSRCPALWVQALPSGMRRSLAGGLTRSALAPTVDELRFKLDRAETAVLRARPRSGKPSQVGVLTLEARMSQGLVGDVAQLQAGLEPVIIGSSLGGRRAMHFGEITHLSPGRNSGRSQILAVEHLFSQVTMNRESAPAEVVAEWLVMSERQRCMERMMSYARTSQGLVGDVA